MSIRSIRGGCGGSACVAALVHRSALAVVASDDLSSLALWQSDLTNQLTKPPLLVLLPAWSQVCRLSQIYNTKCTCIDTYILYLFRRLQLHHTHVSGYVFTKEKRGRKSAKTTFQAGLQFLPLLESFCSAPRDIMSLLHQRQTHNNNNSN